MPGVRFQDAALGPNAARGKLCRWTTAPTLPCRTNQKLLGQPQESSPATSIAFAPNATTSFACPLISSMPSSAQSATKVSSTLSFFFHVALTFVSSRPLPVAPASWAALLSPERATSELGPALFTVSFEAPDRMPAQSQHSWLLPAPQPPVSSCLAISLTMTDIFSRPLPYSS